MGFIVSVREGATEAVSVVVGRAVGCTVAVLLNVAARVGTVSEVGRIVTVGVIAVTTGVAVATARATDTGVDLGAPGALHATSSSARISGGKIRFVDKGFLRGR